MTKLHPFRFYGTYVSFQCTYPKRFFEGMHASHSMFRMTPDIRSKKSKFATSNLTLHKTPVTRVCLRSVGVHGDMQEEPMESFLKGKCARQRACKVVCRAAKQLSKVWDTGYCPAFRRKKILQCRGAQPPISVTRQGYPGERLL